MNNFEIKMQIDSRDLESLISEITENVNDSVKDNIIDEIKADLKADLATELKDEIEDSFDFNEKIDKWMGWNFDISDYLENVNFRDYLDLEDFDVEEKAKDLLRSYSPTNPCVTGKAFTEAVADAVRYLLLDNEYVDYLARALDRNQKAKMKNEIEENLRQKHFNEFKAELEKLSSVPEQNIAVNNIYNNITNI